jgi:general secretion pathway protein D
LPKVVWKLFSSITNTKILARPRIRGLDREKIEIKLGEKRPILRTTFVPVSSGGQDQQPISAYDMKDVGISIRITPTIHHNREVTLEMNFELTYVTDLGGTYMPPTLGNRKVSSTLRLRDSETGIIAGLTRGTTTEGSDGIPLLSSIPVLKEVFSSRSKTRERTDILISITPRILRMPEITRSDLEAYLIGTGQRIELKKWKGYKKLKSREKK